MADELFHRFLRIENLRRAWHLAYHDAKDAFIRDAFGWEDFGAHLDIYVRDLQRRLRSDSYEPRPLMRIDVPKSSLAVRPGATPEIEDSIVMFAIILQVAPLLDRRMSDSVYAYRVSSRRPSRTIFEHRDLAFLRRKTRRTIGIFKEWYELWPAFQEEGVDLFVSRGHRFLSVSDIAAYYENISHPILRDILLGYLHRQQRIVNILMRVLQAWAWPSRAGYLVPRGIPQGPDFSGFLANVYLMPLDRSLEDYGRRHPIRYVRYVDDVRIFSKTEDDARAVLGLMNDSLRALQLNIQGSKTAIYRGKQIEEELLDPVFTKIDSLATRASKIRTGVKESERRRMEKRGRKLLGIVKKEPNLGKKGSRRLRRLLTALSVIKSGVAVDFCLRMVREDPEHRLNEKASRYLAGFPRRTKISRAVLSYLSSKRALHYPSQQAQLLRLLRISGARDADLNRLVRSVLASQSHWYVKQEALLAVSGHSVEPATLREVWKTFERGANVDLMRAAFVCLVCATPGRARDFLPRLYREVDSKVLRTARYMRGLMSEEGLVRRELDSLARLEEDRFKVEKLYKWPLFALVRNHELRVEARTVLLRWYRHARRPHLRRRLRDFLQLYA